MGTGTNFPGEIVLTKARARLETYPREGDWLLDEQAHGGKE